MDRSTLRRAGSGKIHHEGADPDGSRVANAARSRIASDEVEAEELALTGLQGTGGFTLPLAVPIRAEEATAS
jgi:hypothetical protein